MQVVKDAYLSSWAIFEASKSVTVMIEIKSFVLSDKIHRAIQYTSVLSSLVWTCVSYNASLALYTVGEKWAELTGFYALWSTGCWPELIPLGRKCPSE